MLVTLLETKEWLGVEHDLHDGMISRIIGASEIYIKNGTGHDFDSSNELAQQLCLVLVTDMYENRTFTGPSEKIRPTVRNMIEQLTYCYEGDT
ncbi:head-tail connector protein [Bacillus sp. SCS-151]|uniref:head-tail connector protein n=1 Tax=Nanhaiella sioensis TaxID=3115293 RepID=UPI00397C796E